MKTQIMFVVALLVGGGAYAQQAAPAQAAAAEPAAQAAPVQYDEATNTVVDVKPATVVQTRANPIVILNNQPLQEQPTTTVEASPLVESQADRMRKQRQGLEVNTEQRIVEKLEESRMNDERERAERLFSNGFTKPTPAPAPVAPAPAPVPVVAAAPVEPVPVVVAPQPVQVQAIAPAPAVVAEKEDKVDVHAEIRAAIDELNAKKEEKPKASNYIGALVGVSEYDGANNVNGGLSSGVTVGHITPDRVVMEGTFLYSEFTVDDANSPAYPWKDMQQYGVQAALKYQLFSGTLRPFAGAVLGYTHRTASNRQLYGQNAYGQVQQYGVAPDTGEGSSDAVDAGLTAGADISLAQNFSIGGEARYMHNLAVKRDYGSWNDDAWYQSNNATPVEELDYYTLTLSGKFTF